MNDLSGFVKSESVNRHNRPPRQNFTASGSWWISSLGYNSAAWNTTISIIKYYFAITLS